MVIVEQTVPALRGEDIQKVRHRVQFTAAIADTLQITGGNVLYPHITLGVRMLDASGDSIDVDTGGTFEVLFMTWNSGIWEAVPDGTLQATGLETIDFRGDWEGVQVTPSGSGFVEAAEYEVRITAFRS